MLQTDLHWLMARAARGLGVLTERTLKEHDVGSRGYVLLAVLAEHEQLSQLALGRAAAFDKSTVVRIVDELEEAGLVVRTADVADRRIRNVSLTPAGTRALKSCHVSVTRLQDELLETLSPARRQALLSALLDLGTGATAATFDTKAAV